MISRVVVPQRYGMRLGFEFADLLLLDLHLRNNLRLRGSHAAHDKRGDQDKQHRESMRQSRLHRVLHCWSVASGAAPLRRLHPVRRETLGGNITLDDVSATVVEAGTVGGRVSFSGSIVDGGEYFFGSHGGTITITVPEGTDAEVSFATIHGSISSNFSGVPDFERGQRSTFTIGSGGATIEAETFGGRIVLRRGGSESRQDLVR